MDEITRIMFSLRRRVVAQRFLENLNSSLLAAGALLV
ncbi:MAG: hypothetical protein QOD99_2183, partial [Chthoniobacter sp.]|nr:hypothetical protein [Chthoniobacter sp.]